MAKRVSFSDQELELEKIAAHYESLTAALREYYSAASPSFLARHSLNTRAEVEEELSLRLAEVEHTSSLSILAATEAALRIDYLMRAYNRSRDSLSRTLRAVYSLREEKASLEDDIVAAWASTVMPKQIAGHLKGAFKYRHWLAHGRYWTPKFGQVYDYYTVYSIAVSVFNILEQYEEGNPR
jgi:hypothetical protein